MTTGLHARLLAELGKPYEIWAPGNVVTPIARQRAALLAVVELHAPGPGLGTGDLVCAGPCREPWGDSSDWPCSTIQAIADQLGLTEGDQRD